MKHLVSRFDYQKIRKTKPPKSKLPQNWSAMPSTKEGKIEISTEVANFWTYEVNGVVNSPWRSYSERGETWLKLHKPNYFKPKLNSTLPDNWEPCEVNYP